MLQGPNTSSGYLSPLEQLRSTAWALSPITLPAAATLNRTVQISCPKMANNYLFIGRWGEDGVGRGSVEGLLKNRGPCQKLQQETADTRVSFYTPASPRCQDNKVSSLAPQPGADTPWKGMQITGKGGKVDAGSARTGTYRLFQHSSSTGVAPGGLLATRRPHFLSV